ncbi:MAG: hypothetical protein VX899_13275 [Myxococcota bacterium]|nr:hypothetical protein [Myxococcota bacterium]
MAHQKDPELAFFLRNLASEDVVRLSAFLNGEAAFAREQSQRAAHRVARGELHPIALAQCQEYSRRSLEALQQALGELAVRGMAVAEG